MHDPVNSPIHYADGNGVECIDAIEASMSTEEFKGFLKGNVQKYVWRYSQKNGAEDLKKSKWYLERLIKLREFEEAMEKATEETTREMLGVTYDPDDYQLPSGCPVVSVHCPTCVKGLMSPCLLPFPIKQRTIQ
jgi:hypothetical protein